HRKPYTIYGYKGKQVRDQIDSMDVIRALEAFADNPRPGEVYNLGGGRSNSASVLECIDLIEKLCGHRIEYRLSDQNRIGDHICYISDTRKFQRDYPQWGLKITLEQIVTGMIQSAQRDNG
ncbi:MAG: NAD-dependent epimerase, partial [Pirellula sp.]